MKNYKIKTAKINLLGEFPGGPKSLQMVIAAMKLWFFQWSCMDVRVGLRRKLSAKELMLLNRGVGKDS